MPPCPPRRASPRLAPPPRPTCSALLVQRGVLSRPTCRASSSNVCRASSSSAPCVPSPAPASSPIVACLLVQRGVPPCPPRRRVPSPTSASSPNGSCLLLPSRGVSCLLVQCFPSPVCRASRGVSCPLTLSCLLVRRCAGGVPLWGGREEFSGHAGHSAPFSGHAGHGAPWSVRSAVPGLELCPVCARS